MTVPPLTTDGSRRLHPERTPPTLGKRHCNKNEAFNRGYALRIRNRSRRILSVRKKILNAPC